MRLKDATSNDLRAPFAEAAVLVGISNMPDESATGYAVEILQSQFGDFTVDNLKEAARLYAGGSLSGFDHYQRFSPAFVGKLMTAYKQHLKESGKLISSYDAARQFRQTNELTERGDTNWLEYLLDVREKFRSKRLDESTLFIPAATFAYLVRHGYMKDSDWIDHGNRAKERLQAARKVGPSEFVTLNGSAVSSDWQMEAKKMAVLDWLVKGEGARIPYAADDKEATQRHDREMLEMWQRMVTALEGEGEFVGDVRVYDWLKSKGYLVLTRQEMATYVRKAIDILRAGYAGSPMAIYFQNIGPESGVGLGVMAAKIKEKAKELAVSDYLAAVLAARKDGTARDFHGNLVRNHKKAIDMTADELDREIDSMYGAIDNGTY